MLVFLFYAYYFLLFFGIKKFFPELTLISSYKSREKYLSSFGAVYQNSQFYLIKNILISFGFSLGYLFVINILPGILRIYSLKKKKGNAYINSVYIFNLFKIWKKLKKNKKYE